MLSFNVILTHSEKVQEEIDKVVGRSHRPIMDDRSSMPYTDAVIHEVQRMGNVVPLSVPRMTNEDTIFKRIFHSKGEIFDKTW